MASSTPASVAEPIVAAPDTAPMRAGRPGAVGELARSTPALVGFVLAALVILGAVLAPLIAPADPVAMSPRRLALPGAGAWLGTDQFGRDLLSRLLHGARISMAVSFS